LQGTIVGGYQVGRKIGFPTANLQVDFSNKLIPSVGVYAVYVYVNGQKYKGMLNIGHRPTLNNGTDLSIEVHILDFEGDIYHQPMRIEFIDFLRTEAKFQSTEELALQIQKDKEAALLLL
jgi:riboflavin kinase/FMN adenylyltransferase